MEARHLVSRAPRSPAQSFVLIAFVILALSIPVATVRGAPLRQESSIELPEGFSHEVYVEGITEPTTMAFAPDGRMFVAERDGDLRVVVDGELLPEPFLSVDVVTEALQGLLGVTFDPDFEENGYVYVHYTSAEETIRVSRFETSDSNPNRADPGSETVLVEVPRVGTDHNGGGMGFGPDGMLYVSIGDTDTHGLAQDMSVLSGKVLRIDPSSYPDIVPPDNPYVGTPGVMPEIWASGLRNPFTLAVDPINGRILVNNVGNIDWEEINELEKGANYGWPWCEGNYVLATDQPCPDEYTAPAFAYPHFGNPLAGDTELIGCSIIGGYFYYGERLPEEYVGSYFFLDHCGAWMARLTAEGDVVPFARFTGGPQWLSSLATAEDGIYYTDYVGDSVHRIVHTGLVADVAATPGEGPAGTEVTFDAGDSRSADGNDLSFAWDFGDGETGTGETVTHRYESEGQYEATVTVTDGEGNTAIAGTTVVIGTPPEVTIGSPDEGPFDAGEPLRLIAEATDAEGEALPDDAFTWEASLVDGDREIPAGESLTGEERIAFTVPAPPDSASVDAYYRVAVTATDADGLTDVATYDVSFDIVELTLESEPSGASFFLDGSLVAGGHSEETVAGAPRLLDVPSPQRLDGELYEFVGWSNGAGEDGQVSVAPTEDTTYVARFEPLEDDGTEAAYDGILGWVNESWDTTVDDANSSPVYTAPSSLAVTFGLQWAGFARHSDSGMNTGDYTHLEFAVHPGELGFPRLRVALFGGTVDDSMKVDPKLYATPAGGGWYVVRIPLEELQAANTTVTDLLIQDWWGIAQPTFYIDDLRLVRRAADDGMPTATPTPEPAGPASVFSPVPDDEEWPEARPAPSTGGTPGGSGAPEGDPTNVRVPGSGQLGGSGQPIANEGSDGGGPPMAWLVLPLAAVLIAAGAALAWRRRSARMR